MDEKIEGFREGCFRDLPETLARALYEGYVLLGWPLVETVVYKKGHRDSRGKLAPWTIVSHKTGKILSSHPTKRAADRHLAQMEYYKHRKK